jgi:hypothetical protein
VRHPDLLYAAQRLFFKDQPWKGIGRKEGFWQVVVLCLKFPYLWEDGEWKRASLMVSGTPGMLVTDTLVLNSSVFKK